MALIASSAELFDKALQHQIAGQLPEALELWSVLLQRSPNVVQVCLNHGTVCMALGQHAQALDSFEKAIALRPHDADIRNVAGAALQHLGRSQEALEALQHAIALNPLLAGAHFNCGAVYTRLRRHEEALACYERVVQLCPDLAEARNRCGVMRQLLGRYREALADYDRAVALAPNNPGYLYDRATCLGRLARYEEALADYDRAIALQPDFFMAHSNRAQALMELNRIPDALAGFDDALALKPGHPGTACWKALALLSVGNFHEGLAVYEARLHSGGPIDLPSTPPPLWTGVEPIAGKSLLLHAEQGLGDTIQFSRYARLAAARGAKVFFAAPARLMRLLSTLSADVHLVDKAGPLPDSDFQAMLMSMPHLFGTEVATIPGEAPYLAAEPQRVARWAARIGNEGLRIGLAWHGDTLPVSDHRRTLPLAQLAPLTRIPGVRLISLQKGAGTEQLDALPHGMTVETLGPDFDEGPDAFLDAAAVIAGLDLVISSDTAIAHLAGALGKPVWLALKRVPDWRWLKDRSDTPWYPGMRLFRQTQSGDWTSVFREMEIALRDMMAGRTGGPA